jgi:hypothetical protein
VSKKTVLSMLFLALAAATVFPLLSCNELEEPQTKMDYLFNEPDTASVTMHSYWSTPFVVTYDMLKTEPYQATLTATLSCVVPPAPDNKLSWYILDSANYASYQSGNTNPQALSSQLSYNNCTLVAHVTTVGTYWFVADNRADTLGKRFYGWISQAWHYRP